MRQQLDNFEVVVVDNAGDESLGRKIAQFVQREVPVRYVHEPRLGLHNARHCGALAAESDLLLYTDDDAVCTTTWVGAYVNAFQNHAQMSAAGGPVAPLWDREPDFWLRELALSSSSFTAFSIIDLGTPFRAGTDGVFFGNNMAIRKAALLEVGGFNPEMFADEWVGDGETGLLDKLRARGAVVGWVPDAKVLHRITERRMTSADLCLRMRKEGAAAAYNHYHPCVPGRSRLLKDAIAHALRAVKPWLRGLGYRHRPTAMVVGNAMKSNHQRAFARYALTLCFSRRLRQMVDRTDWLDVRLGGRSSATYNR
jgi:glucosyl-dolichyl phosphate glucuronosyltransferase